MWLPPVEVALWVLVVELGALLAIGVAIWRQR